VTVSSFFIAVASAYYRTRAKLQNADQQVAKIESTLQQVATVLVLSVRQDEQLITIKRRVDRLEQLPGWSSYPAIDEQEHTAE
jgi:hypothetical protein